MTKDEARARLERHLGFAWDAGTKGGKDGINHGMKLADAFAQAHTDAALEPIQQEVDELERVVEEKRIALADTLGLLELIAKRTDETVELGRVTVEYQAGRGTYIYSIHYDDDLRHGWFDVSRAEAEALLVRGEKKG